MAIKVSVISVKVSGELKESLSILAELYNTDISGYIRQVLKDNVAQNAELIDKAIELQKKYEIERKKLLAQIIDAPAVSA